MPEVSGPRRHGSACSEALRDSMERHRHGGAEPAPARRSNRPISLRFGGSTPLGRFERAPMTLLLDAFWRAAAYCLHPRVIVLSILPLVAVGGVAALLGYFYWEGA